jgi:hypothetical protein
MSQWKHLTDDEVLEQAEQHAERYTQNHIDAWARQAFIAEIKSRGLDRVFDTRRIQISKNPEFQVAKQYYGSTPRIFFTEESVNMPPMYFRYQRNEHYPTWFAFPEPEYRRVMYLDLKHPGLYSHSPDTQPALIERSSLKMSYFYVLKRLCRERPSVLHVNTHFGTFRAELAEDLLNAINHCIADKVGIDQVIVHGLPRDLAQQLVNYQDRRLKDKWAFVAKAQLIN